MRPDFNCLLQSLIVPRVVNVRSKPFEREMNQDNKTPETPETPESESPATEAAANAETRVEDVDPVAALTAENAELKDRVLRTMADMENLRRRTEKELRDARQYSAASFARDMLTVCDNLRRALEAVSPEARSKADDVFKALVEGVEMTEREMLNQLEKHGVRKIDASGQKFDPNSHQAMFEVPDPQVPASTVVQVVQDGYVIGDRVLRPALVGVSKGGPKEAPRPVEADGQPGSTVDRTA